MTTGKTIALTKCSFDGKVISLLFNMLSRLVIAFLPMIIHIQFSSVAQSWLTVGPHGLQHARLPCPSPTPRTAVQPSHPLSSILFLPSIFPSIRVFSNESVLCIWWPKYWSFSINHSNEYSGLIFFRMDWLDLLAVQGTLKSLLQHHSSKSINSLVLSCLYSSTLTSIHDYWENYSFD